MTDSFPLLSISMPPSFSGYEPVPSPHLPGPGMEFVYHPPAVSSVSSHPMFPTMSSGSSDSVASPPSVSDASVGAGQSPGSTIASGPVGLGGPQRAMQKTTPQRRTHIGNGPKLTREQRASRRREQNRNAQRALRRRKEIRITELETMLITMQYSESALIKRNQSLADMVDCLRHENNILRGMVAGTTSTTAGGSTASAAGTTSHMSSPMTPSSCLSSQPGQTHVQHAHAHVQVHPQAHHPHGAHAAPQVAPHGLHTLPNPPAPSHSLVVNMP